MIIRCFVAAVNANGDPDFYFVKVDCTQDQYDFGLHYSAAMQKATAEGYTPYLAYDENDSAGKSMMDKFNWDSADTVKYGSETELSNNWLVRVYDKNDKEIASWTIENRTEHEARRETEAELHNFSRCDDWTMSPV